MLDPLQQMLGATDGGLKTIDTPGLTSIDQWDAVEAALARCDGRDDCLHSGPIEKYSG